MSDPWNARRLCDDDGLVDGEYLTLHNQLVVDHHPHPDQARESKPFACTGSAHFGPDLDLVCTNPKHYVEFDVAGGELKGSVRLASGYELAVPSWGPTVTTASGLATPCTEPDGFVLEDGVTRCGKCKGQVVFIDGKPYHNVKVDLR